MFGFKDLFSLKDDVGPQKRYLNTMYYAEKSFLPCFWGAKLTDKFSFVLREYALVIIAFSRLRRIATSRFQLRKGYS